MHLVLEDHHVIVVACPGPPASCGNCVSVSREKTYGTREAMLQLICSNLDCNHGALRALVGKVFTDNCPNWISHKSLLCQYLILALFTQEQLLYAKCRHSRPF